MIIKVEAPKVETDNSQAIFIPTFNLKHFNTADDEEDESRFKKKKRGPSL